MIDPITLEAYIRQGVFKPVGKQESHALFACLRQMHFAVWKQIRRCCELVGRGDSPGICKRSEADDVAVWWLVRAGDAPLGLDQIR